MDVDQAARATVDSPIAGTVPALRRWKRLVEATVEDPTLLVTLAVVALACPLLMWLMMRGRRSREGDDERRRS